MDTERKMEDYSGSWDSCLRQIRDRLGDERVYGTWFACIGFECYDSRENVLTLRVPSHYVYEYLEQYGVRFMAWAVSAAFGNGVRLQYRIVRPDPSFADVAGYLRQHGYNPDANPYSIAVPDARRRLEDGLRYFLPEGFTWLPAYDRIAEWLTDNKGRGLLCVGAPGLGKSLICRKILPVILGNNGRPVPSVTSHELHEMGPELMRERLVIIDDLGKEPRRHFGETDNTFHELCNNAERNGNLLIITTNLSTTAVSNPLYPDSIERRYGPEVLDRLRAIVRSVEFRGASMRGATRG